MKDLDWSDVEADAARMQWDDEQYDAYADAQAEEQFRAEMGAWVEDQCEGHESLRGDMMGAEVFCDGTCRPESERNEAAYLEYLESMLPDD